jgi:hypothetical protein
MVGWLVTKGKVEEAEKVLLFTKGHLQGYSVANEIVYTLPPHNEVADSRRKSCKRPLKPNARWPPRASRSTEWRCSRVPWAGAS